MAAYDPTKRQGDIADVHRASGLQAYWLALDGDELIGMMRFEPHGDGAAAILDAPDKVHCTGAFVRRDESQQGNRARRCSTRR